MNTEQFKTRMAEQKTLYQCSLCSIKAILGLYEAQQLGWYWERRIGTWYDYYCPECAKKIK